MKTRHAALLLSLAAASAFAAEPTLEFTGVLTDGKSTRVALTDKAKGVTSWVEPGAQAHGVTVDRYDAATDTVFVKHGLEELRLKLVAAKSAMPSAPAAAPVAATPPAPPPPIPGPAPVALPATTPLSGTPPESAPAPAPNATVTATPPPATPPPATPAPQMETPSTDPTTSVSVRPGDTLERIAAAHGVTAQQLQALNPGVNPSSLKAGQVIRIRE